MAFPQINYTKQDLWKLFGGVVVPLHLWLLYNLFNDLGWIIQRKGLITDGLGLASYSLVFALLESLALTAILVLLGALLLSGIDPTRRVSILICAFTNLVFWAILGQLYFLLQWQIPAGLKSALIATGMPLRIVFAAIIGMAASTITLTIVASARNRSIERGIQNYLERIAPLAALYLAFDGLGLIYVIVRNLAGWLR